MGDVSIKLQKRLKRKQRIRKKVSGTPDKPRLSVSRSAKHIYAQIIDDTSGKTLAAASTLSKELRGKIKSTGNIEAATIVGEAISRAAKKKKVTRVIFDRNGYLYHGRVRALAEAARAGGLDF